MAFLTSTDRQIPDVFLVRLCLAGALVAAAFAAYISLVPFNFRSFSIGELRHLLDTGIETGISSRANFLANVVLFLPIGFLGGGAFYRVTSRLASAVVVICAAAALSITIEALQVFVPGRTPSMADVLAQLVGTATGYSLWCVIGGEVARWAGKLGAGRSTNIVIPLLTLYAGSRALALLLPLDVTVSLSALAQKYEAGGIRLVPFTRVADADFVPDVLTSIALAVPIGVLATIGWTRPGVRRDYVASILWATAYVGLLEMAQVVVMSRVADSSDVLTGMIGATLGVVLAGYFAGRSPAERMRPAPRVGVFSAVVAACAFYVLYNWGPFDFVLSRSMVRDRLGMLFSVPFFGYYQNSEWQAVSDFFTKFLVAAPLGIATGWRFASAAHSPYPRFLQVVSCVLAMAFFAVVEVGQLFLPQRYPDSTDILIAALGFACGLMLTMRVLARAEPPHVRVRV